ncbi:hypothetical protein ACGFX8_34880 [Streptomyces sp. NPDC048362]|uniref:hypothetical protein n=1 Tax=Streptomyces sp. NPDC048362 TaxID=3365539 RepID=UPI0037246C03
MWPRRHHLALGPDDDELHEALEEARARFEDILVEGRRTPWFMDEKRRETGRRISDLGQRRDDQKLMRALYEVADAWTQAFANAPARAVPRALSMDRSLTARQRADSARDQEQFSKQAELARGALDGIRAALARLNELERKTLGR